MRVSPPSFKRISPFLLPPSSRPLKTSRKKPPDAGSEERPPTPTRWQVAVHEAAHAAYAHRQGIIVSYVTIEGIIAFENGCDPGEYWGACNYDWDGEGKVADLIGCTRCLVGNAAWHKVGWLEPLLPYREFVPFAEAQEVPSDAALVLRGLSRVKNPEALYEAARKEAEAFVEDHWSEIIALAEKLMEKVTLDTSDVSAVLGPGWSEFRDMLDEMAREDDLAPWMRDAMEEAGVEDPGEITIGPDGGPLLNAEG